MRKKAGGDLAREEEEDDEKHTQEKNSKTFQAFFKIKSCLRAETATVLTRPSALRREPATPWTSSRLRRATRKP